MLFEDAKIIRIFSCVLRRFGNALGILNLKINFCVNNFYFYNFLIVAVQYIVYVLFIITYFDKYNVRIV